MTGYADKKLPIRFKQRLRYVDIECSVWFTAAGRIMPLLIKLKDENDIIYMIDKIHIDHRSDRSFSGVLSSEFYCTVIFMEQEYKVKLIYFKEDSKWVIDVSYTALG